MAKPGIESRQSDLKVHARKHTLKGLSQYLKHTPGTQHNDKDDGQDSAQPHTGVCNTLEAQRCDSRFIKMCLNGFVKTFWGTTMLIKMIYKK